MIIGKKAFLIVLTAVSILLCACAGNTTPPDAQTSSPRTQSPQLQGMQSHSPQPSTPQIQDVQTSDSPEAAAEYVMENLKALNLEQFNEYTDNYLRTHRNWIGIPTSREYRVFNELLQPTLIKGKHYERNYRFSQKLMQNLSWKITSVAQEDGKAQVDMEITNTDMAAVTENYTALLLENMAKSNGIGIGSLINDLSDLARNMDDFTAIMDSSDISTCTINVTLSLWQEKGKWKLHISDEFINAFMGNMDSEAF